MAEPRRILITGCSSGFGKLAVPRLLERGHTVLAGIRGGEDRLQSVLGPEKAMHPERLHAVDLHMDREETLARAREAVAERFGGKLDVLINNAGFGVFGALEDLTPADFRAQFEVNFIGPALLTRELLPALRAARGRVINVSSMAGLRTFPGYGSYCASKHALEAFSEGLCYELLPFGVQVALLEPGGFKTGFSTTGKRAIIDESSVYAPQMKRLISTMDRFQGRLPGPEPVVRKIVSLVERKRVPLRTLVGVDAHAVITLARFMPGRLWTGLLKTVTRLAMR